MVEKQKYQAYASATQTVAPARQIVLLYEGIIRLMQQSKEAISEKRIEDRFHLLVKASELVGGLQGCLDFDNGGEIARILYSYYSSIDARIFAIHRTNSIEECDAVIADLKQMRDAWSDIDNASSSQSQAVETAATEAKPAPVSQQTLPPAVEGPLTLSA